ncbi:hypothetical protein FQN57_004808 [Myotisia sp. PD_48]|nr:hypothetical protein FQN57_004808 [Myotisia sp. PD_48]
MGITGSGKSSLISLLCEMKPTVGHGLEACTKKVTEYRCNKIPGKEIILIDTPGFDDTTRTDTEVLRELATWLTISYSDNIKLNGLIYLHRITDVRMQGSAKRNLTMFKKLCGDDVFTSVLLVTSMWDLVSASVGASREKELLDTPEFWGWMKNRGSKTFRLDHSAQGAKKLLQYFVPVVHSHVVLDIQHQMVDDKKPLEETSAGRVVAEAIAAERKRFQRELQVMRDEMKKAIETKDKEAEENLNDLKMEYDVKLKRLAEDQRELKKALARYTPSDSVVHQQPIKGSGERHVRLKKTSGVLTESTSLSSNCELVAIAGCKGTRVWCSFTGELLRILNNDFTFRVAFSPNDKLVAGIWCEDAIAGPIYQNSSLTIWDYETGEPKSVFSMNQLLVNQLASPLIYCSIGVCVPNKRTEITAFTGSSLKWNVRDPICSNLLGYCPTNLRLVSASTKGTIHLLDEEKGKVRSNLRGHAKEVYVLAFSNDARYAASGSKDGTVIIWDCSYSRSGKWKKLYTMKGLEGELTPMAISPTGDAIATGGDCTVRVWNSFTGKLAQSFPLGKKISTVRFSGKGGIVIFKTQTPPTMHFWDPLGSDFELNRATLHTR